MNVCLEGYRRREQVHYFAASPSFHMPPTWTAKPTQLAASLSLSLSLSLSSSALRAEPQPRADLSSNN